MSVEQFIAEHLDKIVFHDVKDFDTVCTVLQCIAATLDADTYSIDPEISLHAETRAALLDIHGLQDILYPKQSDNKNLPAYTEFFPQINDFKSTLRKLIEVHIKSLQNLSLAQKISLIDEQARRSHIANKTKLLHELILRSRSKDSNAPKQQNAAPVCDAETEEFLINHSFYAYEIIRNTQGLEFEFCLACVRLTAALKDEKLQNDQIKLVCKDYLALLSKYYKAPLPTDKTGLTKLCSNLISLFYKGNISVLQFDKFSAEVQNALLNHTYYVLAYVTGMGMDVELLSNKRVEIIKLIFNSQFRFIKLLNNGLTINHVLRLSDKEICTILKYYIEFVDICTSTRLSHVTLFSYRNHLNSLLEDIDHLNNFKNLVCYYFIPGTTLLQKSLAEFNQLLAEPECAIKLFNINVHTVAPAAIKNLLAKYDEQVKLYLDLLNTTGYLLNLDKICISLRILVINLQHLGLDFNKCRAIYDEYSKINNDLRARHFNELKLEPATVATHFKEIYNITGISKSETNRYNISDNIHLVSRKLEEINYDLTPGNIHMKHWHMLQFLIESKVGSNTPEARNDSCSNHLFDIKSLLSSPSSEEMQVQCRMLTMPADYSDEFVSHYCSYLKQLFELQRKLQPYALPPSDFIATPPRSEGLSKIPASSTARPKLI